MHGHRNVELISLVCLDCKCESGLKQVTLHHHGAAVSASTQPTTQQADKACVNMTTAVHSNCGALGRMLTVMCSNWQVRQTTSNVPYQPTINVTVEETATNYR